MQFVVTFKSEDGYAVKKSGRDTGYVGVIAIREKLGVTQLSLDVIAGRVCGTSEDPIVVVPETHVMMAPAFDQCNMVTVTVPANSLNWAVTEAVVARRNKETDAIEHASLIDNIDTAAILTAWARADYPLTWDGQPPA